MTVVAYPVVRLMATPTRHGSGWRVVVEDGEGEVVAEWYCTRYHDARRLRAALRSMGCRAEEAPTFRASRTGCAGRRGA